MSTTRQFIFYTTRATPLIENIQLLLTLQPLDPKDLYSTQFPVAWKMANLAGNANEDQQLAVTYTAQLGVAVNQIDGNIIQPSADTPIGLGQTVDYNANGWGAPSPATAPGSGPIFAVNDVENLENISIGTYDPNGSYEPLILETGVTFKATVGGVFHAQLFAYSVNGVTQNQFFTAEIQNNLGSWDLGALPPPPATTYFLVYNDPDTTELLIKQTKTGPTLDSIRKGHGGHYHAHCD